MSTYVFVVLASITSAMSERVLVVTPQSRLSERNEGLPSTDDTYLVAYREAVRGTVSDRRNPLGSYEENYNTLSHSSVIDDDVYPELNHETTHHHKPHHHGYRHHRHPSHTAVAYGPPTLDLSHFHHHQHPEHVSTTHHTLIDIFPPFHFISASLHKYGLYKVVKVLAKIAVLAVILKFITVMAIFLVIPNFVSQEKEKEDSGDDLDLLKSLGDITYGVWSGIAAKEKMYDVDHREKRGNRPSNPQAHQRPPPPPQQQQMMQHPDKDKCTVKDEDKCKDEDKNTEKRKCKDKDEEMEKDKDEGELDRADLKLLKKVIDQWKEENFGGPDKSSTVSFLRDCVNMANRILGMLLGYVKMKHGNMDMLDTMMFGRVSAYVKRFVKMWPHITSGWKG